MEKLTKDHTERTSDDGKKRRRLNHNVPSGSPTLRTVSEMKDGVSGITGTDSPMTMEPDEVSHETEDEDADYNHDADQHLLNQPAPPELGVVGELPVEAATASTASLPLSLPYIDDFCVGESKETPNSCHPVSVEPMRTVCVRGLPEWMDESELKAIIMWANDSLSTQGFRVVSNQQCVTGVQVVRDPETQKCVGYGYVELLDHRQASQLLQFQATLPLQIPNSSKSLTLSWASSCPNASPGFDNYHLYIGNIQPDLSDRTVARLLRAIHPAVQSVRLVPQEILGLAPLYVRSSTAAACQGESGGDDLLHTASANFYNAPHPPPTRSTPRGQFQSSMHERPTPRQSLSSMHEETIREEASSSEAPYLSSLTSIENSLTTQSVENGGSDSTQFKAVSSRDRISPQSSQHDLASVRRWGCGFIRIAYQGSEWKSVLNALRKGVNDASSNLCSPLRRPVHHPSSSLHDANKKTMRNDFLHPSSLVTIRPIFNKFDESRSLNRTTVKQSHTANTGEASRTTIFVGNVADGTTEDDLRTLFSPFGQLLSVRIAFLKHVGFIEFTDHRAALAALSHQCGAVLKRSKLYFDWGRHRGWNRGLPKYIEIESVVDHSSFLSEKSYAMAMKQSMQPQLKVATSSQVPAKDASQLHFGSDQMTKGQILTASGAIRPPDSVQSFWLASLCASLPSRPSQS